MAFCAGELGIPVIFASGCETFTRETQVLVAGIETVAVKRGTRTVPGHNLPEAGCQRHNAAAIHLCPEEARRRIRAGSRHALERVRQEKFGLVSLRAPFRRVTVLRSTEIFPPRARIDERPGSVIALLNQSGPFRNLGFDPLCLEPL